ncbi:MAG TPA: hypothetical protein PLH06_08735 [Candidatus Hydrogenedentes bacterium]|nr:hypothetical protein [Candidatus Hydrogenedentota bacterium]
MPWGSQDALPGSAEGVARKNDSPRRTPGRSRGLAVGGALWLREDVDLPVTLPALPQDQRAIATQNDPNNTGRDHPCPIHGSVSSPPIWKMCVAAVFLERTDSVLTADMEDMEWRD